MTNKIINMYPSLKIISIIRDFLLSIIKKGKINVFKSLDKKNNVSKGVYLLKKLIKVSELC